MSFRLPRRAFLGGAAAGLLAAGAGTAGLLSRGNRASEPRVPAAPQPTLTPTPAPTPTNPRTGGSQTIAAAARFNFDTFDAQLTGEPSVVEILGRTHSRLLQWEGGRLTGDLSERWETPDAQTVVLHLDPAAKWQPRAPLNGRAVAAADVATHLQRSLELSRSDATVRAQRYWTYGSVRSVDSPGDHAVRVHLGRPDPFILDTMAAEFALVQAPEAVASFAELWPKQDSDHVVGSGPWLFDWADDGLKFTAWREGHRKPLLDQLFVVEPKDAAQRFADGSLDEVTVFDRRDAARLRTITGVTQTVRPQREVIMSSFFVGAPPWNQPELLAAMSAALNREWLVQALLGGRAAVCGPVPGVLANVPPGGSGYSGLPGYSPWNEREAADARRRWEAAGGPGLGQVVIDFPSVFDPLYSASSVIVDQLNRVLGAQFRPAVETYTTVSQRIVDGYYGQGRAATWFGWGPPMASPEAGRFVAELYAPDSPGQRAVGGAGLADPWSPQVTVERGFGGVLHWALPVNEVFRKEGVSGPGPTAFWGQHLDYQRSNG